MNPYETSDAEYRWERELEEKRLHPEQFDLPKRDAISVMLVDDSAVVSLAVAVTCGICARRSHVFVNRGGSTHCVGCVPRAEEVSP